QKMLKNEILQVDLIQERSKAGTYLPQEVKEYFSGQHPNIVELHYPVLAYPKKVTSLSLDKIPKLKGKLSEVKGQYLLFQDGTVFNVRTFEGYVVKIQI